MRLPLFIFCYFVCSRVAFAAIPDPQLVFDLDNLSRLESCIIDRLVSQSPDNLDRIIPGGSPTYVIDQNGNEIRSKVEMLAAGVRKDGSRLGYRVQFTAADAWKWIYFQSGQNYGTYVESMTNTVDVFDYRTRQNIFNADVSECSN
jgi:hypothetical protein